MVSGGASGMKLTRKTHYGRRRIAAKQGRGGTADAQAFQSPRCAEAEIDCGVPYDAAADPSRGHSRALSGFLLSAPGDAEQVNAAVRWARQFRVPVQAGY